MNFILIFNFLLNLFLKSKEKSMEKSFLSRVDTTGLYENEVENQKRME